MSTFRPFHFITLLGLLALPTVGAKAQCLNMIDYPGFPTVPDQFGAVTVISTCSYEQEYSQVTGITFGSTYQFTLSSGGFITLREGTYDGPVLAFGYSPLTYVSTTFSDIFAHWTVDDQCNQSSGICNTTTVQQFLNCTPAQGSYAIVEDCSNGQWSINVTVTSTGDGATVGLDYNVNGGPTASTPGLGVGTYTIGPFNTGDIVNVTLAHELDAQCNLNWYNITDPGNCATIVDCAGAQVVETYCYTNSDAQHWHWQSSGGQPLALLFSQGTIESAYFDHLRIYDGVDNQGILLYDHIDLGMEDLTNVLAVSSGPDIYMEMTSDGSVSCADGSEVSWIWTVGCLDCQVPQATFSLIPDCTHRTYQVQMDLTGTGNATTADVYDFHDQDTIYALAVGQHLFGPYGMDTSVHFTVFNTLNSLCRIQSGDLVYNSDSCTIVSCGIDNYTYCYVNNDDAWYVYQADGPYPITVAFQQGEMLSGDHVIIYNGGDDYAAVMYNGNQSGDLTGLAVNSMNPDNLIALRIIGDEAGSCADGGVGIGMHWTVGCGYVGVEDEVPGGFSVFPNPTNDELYLQLNGTWTGNMRVSLVDMMGRPVMEQTLLVGGGITQKLDLSVIASGNYMLQLVTNDLMKTQQVIIAR